MSRHLTRDELSAGLDHIRAAPKQESTLDCIVVRPVSGEQHEVKSARLSLAGGVEGDHWVKDSWKATADGKPDPDVQLCIMNSRSIGLVAQDRARWPMAGNNLYMDLDLSPENLPPGARLAIGAAMIEISAVLNLGCEHFIKHYGRDACVFVNTGEGLKLRMRGLYARVVEDGVVTVGDTVRKL